MNDDTYGFVTPFVLVQSNGGPFDDAAFVAGVTCGALFQELETCAALHALPHPRYLKPAILPQVDLIAMKHGFVLRRGEIDEPSGFQVIEFEAGSDE
jgi:hypothetical protein